MGRRAASFALALAIELLLLLAFFTLNFREKERPEFAGGRLTTFDVSAESEQDRSATPQRQAEVAPARPPRRAPSIPKPKIELPPRPLQMIEVTRETFIASDIAKLGTAGGAPQAGPQLAQGGGRGPGDSARVGTAPNGEPLYAAEWYREPTQAELSAYMPRSIPGGGDAWGLIACKTADRYRVTDCVELGSSPGSRLAGTARQAAWQFLVRPPRVGGKPMIGTWVRIKLTLAQPSADRSTN